MTQSKYRFDLNRWPFGCLLFFLMACSARSETKEARTSDEYSSTELKESAAIDSIQVSTKIVSNGDLIVRCGRDAASLIMRNLSAGEKMWSHCGVAYWENDSPMVYHALGGESNPDMALRRDPFVLFCNPFENKSFGIYRYHLSGQEQMNLRKTILSYYKRHLPFDMKFDLATDNEMYCSELVKKSLEGATSHRISIPENFAGGKKIVGVGNLLTPDCILIKKLSFSLP